VVVRSKKGQSTETAADIQDKKKQKTVLAVAGWEGNGQGRGSSTLRGYLMGKQELRKNRPGRGRGAVLLNRGTGFGRKISATGNRKGGAETGKVVGMSTSYRAYGASAANEGASLFYFGPCSQLRMRVSYWTPLAVATGVEIEENKSTNLANWDVTFGRTGSNSCARAQGAPKEGNFAFAPGGVWGPCRCSSRPKRERPRAAWGTGKRRLGKGPALAPGLSSQNPPLRR